MNSHRSTPLPRFGLMLPILLFIAAKASAAPVERELDIRLVMQGNQHWRADPQATEATTKQEYRFTSRLHSDGVLYSDNLLESNTKERLEIKQQFYARKGLMKLKARNGGKLPAPDDDKAIQQNKNVQPCRDDFECHNESVELIAAKAALQDNSAKDIEEFLASSGNGDVPRYQYYFGYAGCPNRIHIDYEVHVAGTRAYDHEHKKPVPYSLDRSASNDGTEIDKTTLCEKYVAVVDTKGGTVFVENLFVPSARGSTVLNIHGTIEKAEIQLPPVAEVMEWITARMRKTTETGNENVALTLHTPLDGDATVLGMFDGELKLAATWSFKPVASTTVAPAPAAPAH